MRINWVLINTYKNLEAKRIDFSKTDSGVYVIVGKNGSGKSNLLEAISLIFSTLYTNPTNCPFSYGISYEINNKTVEIESYPIELSIKVNGIEQRVDYLKNNYLLPNKVIAVYSGEELRMWEQIYKPFYDAFIDTLMFQDKPIAKDVGQTTALNLMYINKYHWSISLLTLALSETKSCKDFLYEMGYQIESVEFVFDEAKIKANKEMKLKKLLGELKKENRYNINDLRTLFNRVIYGDDFEGLQLNDYDVFEYLLKGNIPKDFKTIVEIKLILTGNLTLKDLSEGEKKKILIFTVMQVLAAENSIVLLDEPDSFLHPSWQKNLTLYIEELANENIILMTTHSPNVVSGTGRENVIRISEGKVLENTPHTLGRDINSIQSEVMGEHFRQETTEQEISEIYDLINRGDLDAAEVAVNALAENKMGYNDFEIIKIKTMIDFEREFQ